MLKLSILTTATVFVLSGVALAEDYCTGEGEPMPTEQVMEKLETMGYEKVRGIEMEHGCYEAKGFDQEGNRVEVYLEPATGEIVKIKKS